MIIAKAVTVNICVVNMPVTCQPLFWVLYTLLSQIVTVLIPLLPISIWSPKRLSNLFKAIYLVSGSVKMGRPRTELTLPVSVPGCMMPSLASLLTPLISTLTGLFKHLLQPFCRFLRFNSSVTPQLVWVPVLRLGDSEMEYCGLLYALQCQMEPPQVTVAKWLTQKERSSAVWNIRLFPLKSQNTMLWFQDTEQIWQGGVHDRHSVWENCWESGGQWNCQPPFPFRSLSSDVSSKASLSNFLRIKGSWNFLL